MLRLHYGEGNAENVVWKVLCGNFIMEIVMWMLKGEESIVVSVGTYMFIMDMVLASPRKRIRQYLTEQTRKKKILQ